MYWRLYEPDGIKARLEETEDIVRECDDLEVNSMGHLFVYDRRRFQQRLHSGSDALRSEISELEEKYAPSPDQSSITMHEYEVGKKGCMTAAMMSRVRLLLCFGR